jgi:hypothetical protein
MESSAADALAGCLRKLGIFASKTARQNVSRQELLLYICLMMPQGARGLGHRLGLARALFLCFVLRLRGDDR